MTTLRRFEMNDLFKFNNINLDVLTETFNMPFYLSYLSQWPEHFTVAEAPDGGLMGYVLAKSEVRLRDLCCFWKTVPVTLTDLCSHGLLA